jgi:hypothetical protein
MSRCGIGLQSCTPSRQLLRSLLSGRRDSHDTGGRLSCSRATLELPASALIPRIYWCCPGKARRTHIRNLIEQPLTNRYAPVSRHRSSRQDTQKGSYRVSALILCHASRPPLQLIACSIPHDRISRSSISTKSVPLLHAVDAPLPSYKLDEPSLVPTTSWR